MAGRSSYPTAYRPSSPAGSQSTARRVPPPRPNPPISARTPVAPLSLARTAAHGLRLHPLIAAGLVGYSLYELYDWWSKSRPPLEGFTLVTTCGSGGYWSSASWGTCGAETLYNVAQTLNPATVVLYNWQYSRVWPPQPNGPNVFAYPRQHYQRLGGYTGPASPMGAPGIGHPARWPFYDGAPVVHPGFDPMSQPPRSPEPDPNVPALPYWALPYRQANPFRVERESSQRGYSLPAATYAPAIGPLPTVHSLALWVLGFLTAIGQAQIINPAPSPWPSPGVVPVPAPEPAIGEPVRVSPPVVGPTYEIDGRGVTRQDVDAGGNPQRPPPKTREAKLATYLGSFPLRFLLEQIFEFNDLVSAVWKAIPRKWRTNPPDLRPNKNKPFLRPPKQTMQVMMADIWRYTNEGGWTHEQAAQAYDNVMKELLTDAFWGRIGQLFAKQNANQRSPIGTQARIGWGF